MIVVGLVGGVASGKSSVAKEFEALGACVLDGDATGHDVLEDPNVVSSLVGRWGRHILGGKGEIHRPSIAKIVFAEEADDELRFLESVTHPAIGERLRQQLGELRAAEKHQVVIVDAAVMLKTGWDRFCDHLVFVDTPRHVRIQRAMTRGLSLAQFDLREKSQISVGEKRKRADFVIDNSGDPQNTRLEVEKVWHSLAQIA